MKHYTIFFVAGEASGDMHTAEMIREIQKQHPQCACCGLGGEAMRQAGAELFFDLPRIAAVGLIEVIVRYHKFKAAFDLALAKVKERRPDVVVLTDFPGFNLRFAKAVRALGIPVIYYVSPQVWAWKEQRIHSIPKIVNKMLVILPFEKELYKDPAMDVEFVGHPLVHYVKPTKKRIELRREFGLTDTATTLLLMPGSRKTEVRKILPIMVEATKLLARDIPTLSVLIAQSPCIPQELFTAALSGVSFPYRCVIGRTYDCLAMADFGLIKSGTSTLEATIAGLPYALIYTANPITYEIGRRLVKIPYLGLANIIAKRTVIPEFIQHDARPDKIAACVRTILGNITAYNTMKDDLRHVTAALGTDRASENAARAVIQFLEKQLTP